MSLFGPPTLAPTLPILARPSFPTSLMPTSLPSTFRPSIRPTRPTTFPSIKPSSSPTLTPNCPAGYYYIFTDDSVGYRCAPCSAGSFSSVQSRYCSLCPFGTFSTIGSSTCQICPAGTFANQGSSSCTLCPFNFYSISEGSQECNSCPDAEVNGKEGSSSKSDCVNPSTNFAIAFFSILLCIIALGPYIGGYRLRRVSFLRRQRLVNHASILFNLVFDKLRTIEKASIELSAIEKRRIINRSLTGNKFVRQFIRIFKYFIFVILVTIIFCSVVLYSVILALLQIVFKSLIIWRGYQDIIPNINEYLTAITFFISNCFDLTYLSYLQYIFYPILFIADNLANFSIDLSTITVSCSGSIAPVRLLIDCIVAGFVVIVIESDMAVFWLSSFTSTNFKFLSLSLNRYFLFQNGSYPNRQVFQFLVGSGVLSLVPSPIKLVQYVIGFFAVSYLIADGWKAADSPSCNAIFSIDYIIAAITSVGSFVMLLPILYLFSQVLVPSFEVDFSNKEAIVSAIADEETIRKISDEVRVDSRSIAQYNDNFSDLPEGSGRFTSPAQSNTHQDNSWYDQSSAIVVVNKSTRRRDLLDKKTKFSIYRLLYSSYQLMAIPFSFDWLYVRIAYNFGYHLYHISVVFLESLALLPEVGQSNKLKVILATQSSDEAIRSTTTFLPTFPWKNVFKGLQKSQYVYEFLNENYEWLQFRRDFPSFLDLVKTTQADYENDHIYFSKSSNYISYVFMNILTLRLGPPLNNIMNFTIISQLRSKRGWLMWRQVLVNYGLFVLAALGIWTDYTADKYGVVEKYEKFKKYNEKCFYGDRNGEASIATGLSSNSLSPSPLPMLSEGLDGQSNTVRNSPIVGISSSAEVTHPPDLTQLNPQNRIERLKQKRSLRYESEEKDFFSNYLAGYVGSRIVLLQILPYFTGVSIFAVDLASSPIFVTNQKLLNSLPPFFIHFAEAKRLAIIELKEQFNFSASIVPEEELERWIPLWKITFVAIYIMMFQSRLIQFFVKFYINAISAIIVLYRDYDVQIVYVTMFIIIFYAIVRALYVLVLFHKLYFNVDDDDDEIAARYIALQLQEQAQSNSIA